MKEVLLTELWDECLRGKMGAFEKVHRALFKELYRYMHFMIRDEGTAEDLVQDLFARLWEKRLRIGPVRNVRVYFFLAARSVAVNYLKRRQLMLVEIDECHLVDFEVSPEEQLLQWETKNGIETVLVRAMSKLRKREKEVLLLKYYEGCSYNEIAEVTGISFQSVANNLHRAIIHLRRELRCAKDIDLLMSA